MIRTTGNMNKEMKHKKTLRFKNKKYVERANLMYWEGKGKQYIYIYIYR